GQVDELYHPGYAAKRMEIGAVIGAAPAENVRRETPAPTDVVLLLGGRTGRDGIGGATGSSKVHKLSSLTESASEVQKGNAPEERKLQRLFRNPEAASLIKRCNDFGAGGVSVAIGELADGLDIDLSKVTKKYEGLGGTELAISESQERMAVVVSADTADRFIELSQEENLEATIVARVTAEPRMVMRLGGETILDLPRDFLSSNGAEKHTRVAVPAAAEREAAPAPASLSECIDKLNADINYCSQRGLAERFDASIGAGSVLMPFGGKTQLTPSQSMAALFPVLGAETSTCSVMSFGFDPYLACANPYLGAKFAVVSSIAKLVASGCSPDGVYLSLQEYFERLRDEKVRWGKPFSALLGALEAQIKLGAAAIGGKDSMSGSFMDLDVPPTLISFAIRTLRADAVISPEFKAAGSYVYLFDAGSDLDAIKRSWRGFHSHSKNGRILSAWAVEEGGVLGGLLKMSFGNLIGFKAEEGITPASLMDKRPGAIIAESSAPIAGATLIGRTCEEPLIVFGSESAEIKKIIPGWEKELEGVFPVKTSASGEAPKFTFEIRSPRKASAKFARPRAVIPVFPGTNCEYDTARALERAGGEAETVIIRNLTPAALEDSVLRLEKAIRSSQMVIIPGGFSGGDEPDGSGKFIATFFRNPRITEAIRDLLQHRDGLMLGICNGFQALIKL
ncbi:MAG: phosphoribosylformylglycinamidine synthase subunit PurQ, partial [Oscillospiraceae bacterium]|nr:phosphoribosylformylglycinamidine synthase subunit PurQ [Oscillospiraceae bacterium]